MHRVLVELRTSLLSLSMAVNTNASAISAFSKWIQDSTRVHKQ